MVALVLAALAAVGFLGGSLLALPGRKVSSLQTYSTAVAAGILLSLAFGDLMPESLELGRVPATWGFIAGFVLLFLTETFTHSHTYHSPEEDLHRHAVLPFVVGLAVHNLADGFVLAVAARPETVAAGAVGLGVLIHQIPVGVSLAAVLIASRVPRNAMLYIAVFLAGVIPLSSVLTLTLPTPGEGTLAAMLGAAGGALTYVSASHLLPEVQSERPNRTTALVFVATLLLTTAALFLLPEA
jgi:zinc transporter, ZIP family